MAPRAEDAETLHIVPSLSARDPAPRTWAPSRKRGIAIALASIPAMFAFEFAFELPHDIVNRALFEHGHGAERSRALDDAYVTWTLFVVGLWLLTLVVCHLIQAARVRMAVPGVIAISAAALSFANVARVIQPPVSGFHASLVCVPIALACFGFGHIAAARGREGNILVAAGWIAIAVAIPTSFFLFVGLAMPSNG